LYVTSDPSFEGSISVNVSVSDGKNTDSTSFTVQVEREPTEPPELAPIADQLLQPGGTLTVPINATDLDTPTNELIFSATSESMLQRLDSELNLQHPGSPTYYLSYRGVGEKYLINPSGSRAERWYYLLPNGKLYRFTGNLSSSSPSSLTGVFVADVGVDVYNDPSLLHSPSTSSPLMIQFAGMPVDAMQIMAPRNFVGEVELMVTVSDGSASDTQSFFLSVQPNINAAPILTQLDDQSLVPGTSLDLALNAIDSDTPVNDLVFDASVASLASHFNETLKLTKPDSGSFPAYFTNYRGGQEKYLLNPDGVIPNRWYYLLPNGDLYRFTGSTASSSLSSLQGVLLGNLGSETYADPSLLHEATAGNPGLTVVVDGPPIPMLSVTTAAWFNSPAIVSVTVSDGEQSDTKSMVIRPTTSELPAAPVAAAWQNQSAPVSLSVFADPQVAAAIPLSAYRQSHVDDVNADGEVTPLDALLVINFIERTPEMERSRSAVDSILAGGPIYDTSGDGHATLLDALKVINYLASHKAPTAESESAWRDGVDLTFADFSAVGIEASIQADDGRDSDQPFLF
jgi:hypothetical protein